MAMPNHLVLVRHGESEGNYLRKTFKSGATSGLKAYLYQFRERPGHEWRLTETGVEQARAAGAWIQEHIIEPYGLPGFDRYFSSPHIRTYETAGHLGLANAQWRIDRRLRERSWGVIENLTGEEEHRSRYPENYEWMLRDPSNWEPPGGESLFAIAESRVDSFMDSLQHEHAGGVDSVLVSGHGEWISAASLLLEQMLSEDWEAARKDKSQKLHNGQVVHYTRLDPVSGQQAPYLRWVRSVCPWQDATAGQWREINRRTLTNAEMLAEVEAVPRIFEN